MTGKKSAKESAKHSGPQGTGHKIDGFNHALSLMQNLDAPTRDRILGELALKDPKMAQRIKDQLIGFEKFLELPGDQLGRLLREAKHGDLLNVLKGLAPADQEVLFRQMSKRKVSELKEELSQTGPLTLAELKRAQSALVDLAKSLDLFAKLV